MYNNTFTYVSGYDSAKSFQTMPNQNVLLIDTENPYIYMKSSNAFGQSNIQCFKIESAQPPKNYSVTQDELQSILDRLNALEGKNEPTVQ